MSKNNQDYLTVAYSETNKPKTEYPMQLATYLAQRFHISKGMRMLDVGCGRGEMIEAFASIGIHAEGLDIANSAMRTDGIMVKKCNIADDRYPYDDEQFDVVFAKSVIEHVLDPTNMLAEIWRVLKPGGILILLTPEFAKLHTVFYEDPTHIHPYLPKSITSLLMMNGFSTPTADLHCHHPVIWRGGIYNFLAKVLQLTLSVEFARWITQKTGIKFIRWAVERQILAFANK